MQKWMAPLAALLVLAMALAGCSSGKDDGPGSALDQNVSGLDLQATSTTGVIRGVVVNEAIAPLDGAKVTLQGTPPMETTTNEQGAFGFDDLPAGTHFLNVHKLGYRDTQQSAEVEAGVAEPPVVKVLLVANPGELPSYELFQFSGFLECNVAAPLVFVPCQNPATDEPIGNDNFEAAFNFTGKADLIHVSLVWTATQPVGHELYYNLFTPPDDSTTCDDCWTGGPSPLLMDLGGSTVDQFNEAQVVQIEVSGNGEQGLAGAELEQPFEAYVVVFHNFLPPEGYSYAADGAPVVPE